jgi:hypothetical protein
MGPVVMRTRVQGKLLALSATVQTLPDIFQRITAISCGMKISIFWNVTQFSLVGGCRRFGELYFLLLQDERNWISGGH